VIKKRWSAFQEFLGTDAALSTLLAVLAILIFVVPSVGLVGARGRLLLDVAFTAVIIAGMAAVSSRRRAVHVIAAIGLVALAIRWAGRVAPSTTLEIATAISGLASILALAYVVMVQVFRAGPVNRQRVQGAIALYLLLGVAWAETYFAIALVRPGAFSIPATVDESSWDYYSFVTLTTVGYGDITPVAPLARSLAVLEALVGQLYPAILLARLVALEVGARGAE